ncbi:hypothetical protein PFAG_04355 [Plasmodium falciparum Santa Lucia]|uniref:Uncharacterized protein n=9 Tax=Plasmodium falciparum TaxID=5833 RepID=Q8IEK2_PLAF7|nr:conserved Plasmodium protein, unknown function [Plasmodium falciparum 3D7]ETW17127.1 hypothetical protein PFFVO_03956 [Plasmodium falciparum Vietnam Oak-Knoll (FVO)]ETW29687.1 hypothetical protein PFFCH_02957 [Plasmodium falciparum FCH/4]ETW40878.1 hypothetical protein PFNF135_04518 [Plasmodium falciparum NF135/5.C10]ETW54778.1 hypothetical protein PFUGPA_03380 [Plasmodium falciparum Palo Alto/Uganda]ETW59858.1 hypothetical protein PFMC_04320 [Plasmodium falciparum CAMP/Malaysia]EUT81136.1|eukprot:XP_001349844.1 conserved Plasmodium protein, unknown function [Plasmodium falciparum 3D7]
MTGRINNHEEYIKNEKEIYNVKESANEKESDNMKNDEFVIYNDNLKDVEDINKENVNYIKSINKIECDTNNHNNNNNNYYINNDNKFCNDHKSFASSYNSQNSDVVGTCEEGSNKCYEPSNNIHNNFILNEDYKNNTNEEYDKIESAQNSVYCEQEINNNINESYNNINNECTQNYINNTEEITNHIILQEEKEMGNIEKEEQDNDMYKEQKIKREDTENKNEMDYIKDESNNIFPSDQINSVTSDQEIYITSNDKKNNLTNEKKVYISTNDKNNAVRNDKTFYLSSNDNQSDSLPKKSIRNNVEEFIRKLMENEDMANKFNVFHIGINKIEALKALYRECKNNFNKSFREKINKLHELRKYYNDSIFERNISVDYIANTEKLNAIKKERLSRLFLYIEDIHKLKQALKVKQHNDIELENDEKKEYFYDAYEDIEDFFIFDHALSYLNNDVETIFTECENSSFFREDSSIDNFLDEVSSKADEEYNRLNIFARFSLKNYYLFDINKNLCSIYAFTPMIIKKFAEKINSYNLTKNEKDINNDNDAEHEKNDIDFTIDSTNNEKRNIYASCGLESNHNLDAYVQFHCDKWQENMYDVVEVNSLELDFNRLKCNIM